jgi:predicted RND superfamily exporter protein
MTFYAIVFWLGIGFSSGVILCSIFWLGVIASLAKRGDLYMRQNKNSNWLPKNPFK